MRELSREARGEMKRLIADEHGEQTFRVYHWSCGCGAPTMGITREARRPGDAVFAEDGFEVAIDRELLAKIGRVNIHFRPNPYVGHEFLVTPERRV